MRGCLITVQHRILDVTALAENKETVLNITLSVLTVKVKLTSMNKGLRMFSRAIEIISRNPHCCFDTGFAPPLV